MDEQTESSKSSSSRLLAANLDRTTESEGIVVEEGSCELADPSFSNAAIRLAHLNVTDYGSSTQPQSSPSAARSLRSSMETTRSPSSKVDRASFDESCARSISRPSLENSLSSKSRASLSSEQTSLDLGHMFKPGRQERNKHLYGDHAGGANGEAIHSEDQNFSPFGDPELQRASFESMGSQDRPEDRLNVSAISKSLLSGLMELSSSSLAAYLQVAEQMKAKGLYQQDEPRDPDSPPAADADLQVSIRELHDSVPGPALQSLQRFEAYGLAEVIPALPSRE